MNNVFEPFKSLEEQKTAVLRMVTHDFAGHLDVIAGKSGLLLSGTVGELTPRARERVENIKETARRLDVLRKDIADDIEARPETPYKQKLDFVRITAHDFNYPLKIIKSMTDMLLTGMYGNLTPEAKQNVEDIKSTAKSLDSLRLEALELITAKLGEL